MILQVIIIALLILIWRKVYKIMAREDELLAIATELRKDIARVLVVLQGTADAQTKIDSAIDILTATDTDVETANPEPPPTG